MAGTIVADTHQSSTTNPPTFQNTNGTQIGTLCRAWVQYNSTSQTVNASFNVSSVTYNGTGDITINFSTSLPDGNYAYTAMGDDSGPDVIARNSTTPASSSSLRCWMGKPNVGTSNGTIGVAIFR